MSSAGRETRQNAVTGNWRYNPTLLEEGKNPFHLDSREPEGQLQRIPPAGEVRYPPGKNSSEEAEAPSKRPKEMPSSAEKTMYVSRNPTIWKSKPKKPLNRNKDLKSAMQHAL